MLKLAEIIPLYEKNARDIAAMLREAADAIEAEDDSFDRTKAICAVQITEGRQLKIYGWGETDIINSIGILQAGAGYLSSTLFNSQDAADDHS